MNDLASRFDLDELCIWELKPPVAAESRAPDRKAAESVQRIMALPAAEQVEEVRKELKARNPGCAGDLNGTIDGGVVMGLDIKGDGVTDLTPVRALTGLKFLQCTQGPLSDLSPLQGMPLVALGLFATQVRDLEPLRDMKLSSLDLNGCRLVRDLGPLKGMPLTRLHLDFSQVRDLDPLQGMPLTHLYIPACTEVRDLMPLKDMKLLHLNCATSGVTDLSPLEGMPLEDIRLTPKNISRGLDVLRNMKSLETIGTWFDLSWPAAEFWARYDKGEFTK